MKRVSPKLLPRLGGACLVLLCLGSTLLGAPGTIFNERKNATFENAPPIPAPVKISLNARSPIRIILRVKGLQKEPVTFALTSEPEHGSAKLLPQVSSEWAELEYTPPQDHQFTRDTFKFAAGNSKGFSSDSIAEITIQDIGPRLEIPPMMDFGIVQTGGACMLPLHLKNTGDLLANGSISMSGEWFIEGGTSSYALTPGESASFNVVFSPKISGPAEGEIRFSSGANRGVLLRGVVENWIHARPDPLFFRIQKIPEASELRSPTGSSEEIEKNSAPEPRTTRQANIAITNETDITQWIQLESQASLRHPPRLSIAPKQTVEVPMFCDSLNPLEETGTLTLRGSEGRTRLVLWRTAAFPPSLGGIDKNSTLVLKPRGDKHLETKLMLWNRGGRPGKWLLKADAPYVLSTGTIELAPGASTAVQVSLAEKTSSKNDGLLQIQLVQPAQPNPSQNFSVVLSTRPPARETPKGALSLPGSKKTKPSAPSDTASSPLPDTPDLSKSGEATEKSNLKKKDLKALQTILRAAHPGSEAGVGVSDVTHHSARITLANVERINPKDLIVRITPPDDDESPESGAFWKEFAPVGKFDAITNPWISLRGRPRFSLESSEPPLITVNLKGLTPAQLNFVRFTVPESAQGRVTFLHQCTIETLPEPHWLSPKRPYMWGVCVFLALSAYASHRRKRSNY
jgi:hypothetical protein